MESISLPKISRCLFGVTSFAKVGWGPYRTIFWQKHLSPCGANQKVKIGQRSETKNSRSDFPCQTTPLHPAQLSTSKSIGYVGGSRLVCVFKTLYGSYLILCSPQSRPRSGRRFTLAKTLRSPFDPPRPTWDDISSLSSNPNVLFVIFEQQV